MSSSTRTSRSSRVHRIWQIAQLKQITRRWRSLSVRRRPPPSDDGPPPPGHLAVYAGEERRRFVIPTRFLALPVFAALLKHAEDEFGFRPHGALLLPCDAALFASVVAALRRDEGRHRALGIEGFVELFARAGAAASCREEELSRERGGAALPLLHKARV